MTTAAAFALLVASAGLAVGTVVAGRRGGAGPWWASPGSLRVLGPVAMLGGTVAMVSVPTAATLSLLAAGFLVLSALEAGRAWAARRRGTGVGEPVIALCCAAAMTVMAMTMTPMAAGGGMTMSAHSAGDALGPVPRALVVGLVAVALLGALRRLSGALVTEVSGRRVGCAVSHCLMCAGMGLPLVVLL